MNLKPLFVTTLTLILFIQTGFSACIQPTDTSNKKWPKVYDIQLIKENANVILRWKAMDEAVEVFYEIEKSTDGINFQPACTVLGGFKDGADFSYQYKSKISGKTYFRIKQLNNDGSFRIVSEQSL
jgi:hypothetical protein